MHFKGYNLGKSAMNKKFQSKSNILEDTFNSDQVIVNQVGLQV